MDNIRRRKDKFIARLNSRLEKRGDCLCYNGTKDQNGYARLSLSYKPDEKRRQIVTIHAHRLFLILKLRRPIRLSHEAGHLETCEHRTCVLHVQEEHYSFNASKGGQNK